MIGCLIQLYITLSTKFGTLRTYVRVLYNDKATNEYKVWYSWYAHVHAFVPILEGLVFLPCNIFLKCGLTVTWLR